MPRAGRIAVVTGGASGIGRAIALRLGRDGAAVGVLDRDRAGAERVAAEATAAGARALAVETDVGASASVAAAAATVRGQLGPVAVLVNSAGIADLVPLLEMSEERWDRMIQVHLKGTFNCVRTFAPDMVAAGWGRIVNVASVAGLVGAAGLAHYAAAKAAIIGFTKSAAQELGPRGVTVNVLAPGMIDTPMLRAAGLPERLFRHAREETPMRRLGLPEDIAAAAAFLVSDEAGFFTGQVMSPNGGGHM
jgi:2-hydroxycyclohexanecarboxyl-CoA dehydrogenase